MSFLSLEAALVERLRAQLTQAVHVLTAADLASVAEGSQPTPAVHVVVPMFRVLEQRGDGRAIRRSVRALIVVAVRNVRGIKTASGAKDAADGLVDEVEAALAGFKPDGFAGPMTASDSMTIGFNAGFMYVPLVYTCEQVTSFSPVG